MGLGMPEVILILVIALIVFGPRKLPELGKSLGQAMAQFRRASDDFKRTWEQEVEIEKTRGKSSEDYPSAESYNPYDPYSSEPETAQLSEANNESAVTPSPEQEQPKTETTPEPAVAAAAPEKQHWI